MAPDAIDVHTKNDEKINPYFNKYCLFSELYDRLPCLDLLFSTQFLASLNVDRRHIEQANGIYRMSFNEGQ